MRKGSHSAATHQPRPQAPTAAISSPFPFMATRASTKNKLVLDMDTSARSPKRAFSGNDNESPRCESSEPSIARWNEDNERTPTRTPERAGDEEDSPPGFSPLRADETPDENTAICTVRGSSSSTPTRLQMVASSRCIFHGSRCNKPRAVMVDIARVEKNGVKYSVEHVCKPTRVINDVSTCVSGAHEFAFKHSGSSFGTPACFACKVPVEILNVESDMGKEVLFNLQLACPNTGCDFHGVYDSFASHNCAHKEQMCQNTTVVDGVRIGCMMTVGGTSAPHKCQFDFVECPDLARRSFFRELHRTALISDGTFFFLMNYC
eukprot:jgi/Mesvir1/19842/Mv13132-RA.1